MTIRNNRVRIKRKQKYEAKISMFRMMRKKGLKTLRSRYFEQNAETKFSLKTKLNFYK